MCRNYDKLHKFVPFIIGNDNTLEIVKIVMNEDLQIITSLCQMSLGERLCPRKS